MKDIAFHGKGVTMAEVADRLSPFNSNVYCLCSSLLMKADRGNHESITERRLSRGGTISDGVGGERP